MIKLITLRNLRIMLLIVALTLTSVTVLSSDKDIEAHKRIEFNGVGDFTPDSFVEHKEKPIYSLKMASAAEESKIESSVYESDNDVIDVIIEASDNDVPEGIDVQEFMLGGFYAAKIPSEKINELASSSDVKQVWSDKKRHKLLDMSVPLIGASEAHEEGLSGKDVIVCVLDTGINESHPALASRVIARSDFTTSNSGAADIDGHGTHVAGIIASMNETYRGVAPDALLFNAKVLNDDGVGSDSWIMSGIDWCIKNGAHIISMSLGGFESPNDGSDALSRYVDLAVDRGVDVIVAAGNDGQDMGSIMCPACAHKVIAVGSTQTGKNETTRDLISNFSSRGPTADGRTKPDVTAPGEFITSLLNTGGFVEKAGTSMAAPHVAGLVALLLQEWSLVPAEVKALLMNTGIDMSSRGKDNDYGAGRINVSRVRAEANFTQHGTIYNTFMVHNVYVSENTKEIRATLYWPENDAVHQDIDLFLLDPSGIIVNASDSFEQVDEFVSTFQVRWPGYWKLLVDPFDVQGAQPYALAVSADVSEQRYFRDGAVNDSFVLHLINVTNASELGVDLTWNDGEQDLDMFLYSPGGELVEWSAWGRGRNFENVYVNEPENGLWVLKVHPWYITVASVPYAITATAAISGQVKGDETGDKSPPIIQVRPSLNVSTFDVNTTFFVDVDDLSHDVLIFNVTNETYIVNGSGVRNGNSYEISIPSSVLADDGDNYTIYISVKDSAGNINSTESIIITIDGSMPNITLTYPTQGMNFSSDFSLNATAIDEKLGVAAVQFFIMNASGGIADLSASPYGNHYNATFPSSFAEGRYMVDVFVWDFAGNGIGSQSISIALDKTPPSAQLVAPPLMRNVSAAFVVNGTARDVLTGVERIIFVVANNSVGVAFNASLTSGSANASLNLTELADGWYNLSMMAIDYAGNRNGSENVTFVLDRTPPDIRFSASVPIQNETVRDRHAVMFEIEANEKLGSAVLEVKGIGERMIGRGRNWSTRKELNDGNYTFVVYANDTAGNSRKSEARVFVVQTVVDEHEFFNVLNVTNAEHNITPRLLANGVVVDSVNISMLRNYR